MTPSLLIVAWCCSADIPPIRGSETFPLRRAVCVGLLILSGTAALAQPMRDLTVEAFEEMKTEPRVGLVIGNSKYNHAPLGNLSNDASDMAEALQKEIEQR